MSAAAGSRRGLPPAEPHFRGTSILHRDVTALVRPRSVAVIGASAKRATQGNTVIGNLQSWGYGGRVVPVHPQADAIDGLPAVPRVAELGSDTDVAIVAIPAPQVTPMLRELEASPVRSAIVFTAGFTAEDEAAMRAFCRSSRLLVHGPNCMGLVNFSDRVPLYSSRPSPRLGAGPVAIVAQSGSAAISIMNSIGVGVSKVVTVGSEFQLSAADYLRWLAEDEHTRAIGVVAETVHSPAAFAAAAECVHAAGKSLVVLKVGRSAAGVAATQAHTGALVGDRDAYDAFFRDTDMATASDYDELIASLECAVRAKRMRTGRGVALVGISGGQTALACDVAESRQLVVAAFSDATVARVHRALPGIAGTNPIDIGATVTVTDRDTPAALRALDEADEVGAVVVLQDVQQSLNPSSRTNYLGVLGLYAQAGKASAKPFVVISPTAENLDAEIHQQLAIHDVPLLRGLAPGLRAVANLARGRPGAAGTWAGAHAARAVRPAALQALADEIAASSGALDAALAARLMRAYELPLVRAALVRDADEALVRAHEVGFPMVVKVASPDIAHRSDIGGVRTGIADAAALRAALARMDKDVRSARPDARIDGYELQEELAGCVEAMAGFTTAPPFGPLLVLGSGGTLVELVSDRAVAIAPVPPEQAAAMLADTRLGRVLGGYRNLMARTEPAALLDVCVKLSRLAFDFADLLQACDLNPVLVRPGTGETRIVDALFVRQPAAR